MRRIIESLAFLMIVLSSGAFIQLIKDGGARDQGLENNLTYSGPLNALPFIWIACVVFVIAIVFFAKKFKKIKLSRSLAALIAFCFLSTIWAEFPTVSFRIALFITAAYLLISIQVALYGWQTTVRFLNLALFAILVCSLITVLAVPSYGISVGAEHVGKWQGVFDHKNSLGNFASMSFLIFIWHYRQKKSRLALIAALLAIVLVIGSQSGTALANMMVVIFISVLLSFKLTERIVYKLRYVIIFLLIALSFFAVFMAIGFEEFSIFEKDSSFSSRNLIWVYVLGKVASSPWFGYGLDQLTALTNKNSAEFFNSVGFLVGSAHNGFIETAFSLGFIGLMLMFWVFVSQLINKRADAGFTLSFGYLVSFIVINTFEARMISFNIYLVGLMYVVAMAAAMTALKGKVSCTENKFNS